MKRKILDIGCGKTKFPGSIGLDFNPKSNADIIVNIEKGLPFKKNVFDLVYSSHNLEHIDPKKLVFVLEEIWRVTKPQGQIIIKGPHFSGAGAATNPTHLRQGFSSQLFNYFISENEYPNYGKISFKIKNIKLKKLGNKNPVWSLFTSIITFCANLNPLFCELFWCYWFGGLDEIEFNLQPIK